MKIFISSKFIGMEQEREVLLKEVFLELKKIARQRDVEVTEIDLRWGITQKTADSGKTVKVCLDEIERCKDSPICFLGMIGSEYGWTEWYDHIDKSLLNDERYSWIEEYKNKSITELEIMSVLKRGDNHNKVLLYLKDDEEESEESVEKLKKELIVLSSCKENIDVDKYENIEEFRKKVKDDLFRVFDELYPESEKLTEKEKLYAPHNSFAMERQKVYISHRNIYDEMTLFLESKYNLACIYGKEGSGKSAFIANYFNNFTDTQVMVYYIGLNNEKEGLRTVLTNIKKLVDLPEKRKDRRQSIDYTISSFLIDILATSKKLCIVIDGIDELKENEKEIFIHHLLEEYEGKKTASKIVITSLEMNTKFMCNFPLDPIASQDKQNIIEKYLLNYGKKLITRDLYVIMNHRNNDNIYFLMTLLNEIRILGNFDNFTKDIGSYLDVKNTVGLFGQILHRFENDYGLSLTQNILSFLYVVRDGLSEDELLGLVNYKEEGRIVNRLTFSPLVLALEPYLSNTNGIYQLKNKYLCEAVKCRYLFTQELENEIRTFMAQYFWNKNESFYDTYRATRETIYQVFKSEEIFTVIEFLVVPMTFFNLIIFDRDMLWKYIIQINELDRERNYLEEIHLEILKVDLTPEILENLAEFMSFDLGAKEYALDILYKLEQTLLEDRSDNKQKLAECYENISLIHHHLAKKFRKDENSVLSLFYAKKALEYGADSFLEYYIKAKELEHKGKFREEGLSKYLKYIKFRETILGKHDQEVISYYSELGLICKQEKLYAKADDFYTICWERTIINYGELSKESYYAALNIAELYHAHTKPLRGMEEILKSLQEKHGSVNKELLEYFKKSYNERVGWETEDYSKFLKVSKLILKSLGTYLENDDMGKMKAYGYLAHAYKGIGDEDNYKKYKQIVDKKN